MRRRRLVLCRGDHDGKFQLEVRRSQRAHLLLQVLLPHRECSYVLPEVQPWRARPHLVLHQYAVARKVHELGDRRDFAAGERLLIQATGRARVRPAGHALRPGGQPRGVDAAGAASPFRGRAGRRAVGVRAERRAGAGRAVPPRDGGRRPRRCPRSWAAGRPRHGGRGGAGQRVSPGGPHDHAHGGQTGGGALPRERRWRRGPATRRLRAAGLDAGGAPLRGGLPRAALCAGR
mmetsp:Transcript_57344/g.131017  ORF Transcript_57344/g.131017 Transcript_57344/m.131017 type:complete len:233 (-) Transcript_57344:377-1075(-)